MTIPLFPQGGTLDDEGAAIADSPVVLDLEAGTARITPVRSPEDGVQYNVELPDGPLTPADAEHLALGLHTTQSGGTVLVDIDDYAQTERQPEDRSNPSV